MHPSLRALAIAPLVSLALLSPAAPTAHADGDLHPEWGSTHADDATLTKGCRAYPYSYALTPPEGDWDLQTFLIGPDGAQLGSDYLLTGSDPLVGTSDFKLCRRAAKGGTYTIRSYVTVENYTEQYAGHLPDSTFHLTKRKHHRHKHGHHHHHH